MKCSNLPYQVEAELLAAMAHPTRVQILELLRQGETCVCHIQAVLGKRQAYVSQQLMDLRRVGLVACRKDGLRVYYQVSDPHIFMVLDELRKMARAQGRELASAAMELKPPPGRCNCPRCTGT